MKQINQIDQWLLASSEELYKEIDQHMAIANQIWEVIMIRDAAHEMDVSQDSWSDDFAVEPTHNIRKGANNV